MKVVFVDREREVIEFAERAAQRFFENPEQHIYPTGQVEEGILFAVRWGRHERAVLVFKLDEYFEPRIYGDLVPRYEDDK